jgi:hypothetical protein
MPQTICAAAFISRAKPFRSFILRNLSGSGNETLPLRSPFDQPLGNVRRIDCFRQCDLGSARDSIVPNDGTASERIGCTKILDHDASDYYAKPTQGFATGRGGINRFFTDERIGSEQRR